MQLEHDREQNGSTERQTAGESECYLDDFPCSYTIVQASKLQELAMRSTTVRRG
jgi:hypothetical protein